jgi:uncharacterized protein
LRRIKFFGGEPFLNLDAIQTVCAYLEERINSGTIKARPELHINTNLTICIRAIVEMLRKYDISLTVSIDGPACLHDRFRRCADGTGSFAVVDRNVLALRETLKRPRSIEAVYGPHHLAAGMSIVELFVFLSERYGGANLFIHPMVLGHKCGEALSVSEWQVYDDRIYDLAFDYGRFRAGQNDPITGFCEGNRYLQELAESLRVDTFCRECTASITVDEQGAVYPCYTFIDRGNFLLANKCTSESLRSRSFEHTLDSLLHNRKSDNAICAGCDIMAVCQCCPGMMLMETGSIKSPVARVCDFKIGYLEGMLSTAQKLAC